MNVLGGCCHLHIVMLQYVTYSLWFVFWFTSDSLMNKKLFRFITSSIISISVIACNLPNNSTKSNSKLDSSLNKLSDSNTTDSEVVHDSDKLSKALSKDKNFFTRENKNSFKTLANHNDIECNPSGIATPEECVCEDSPNTLPDTSLPLTPESMGALNNELDIAKSPEAQELENFHSNLGKIHELENGVNQINAFLAQDKKDKAELEKQKNNPSFSTQSVKNNNKDKASKDKSDPRPHDCKATNPLDCFNTIDEKLAYLDKHIKLLEAKLVKEQTKLTSAQAKQDELFNKIDSSYRPYLISTGKKIREAARALNAKLYPRVNLFSTSNHNKRMDRLELFFNSSKLDFDFYVSAKNTYEMSKAGSIIGREFYIFDDMVYLFIRDGLSNADPTKYNVLASIKKYTRQIEEHLKQYKKENKKLIEYINKLKAQINSQGFRIQAESQAVADYNAATNSKPCPVPTPTPSPSPSVSPSGSPEPSPSDDPESCDCEVTNSGFTTKQTSGCNTSNCNPEIKIENGPCKSYIPRMNNTPIQGYFELLSLYDFDKNGPDLTAIVAPNKAGYEQFKLYGEGVDIRSDIPSLKEVNLIIKSIPPKTETISQNNIWENILKKDEASTPAIFYEAEIDNAIDWYYKNNPKAKNQIKILEDFKKKGKNLLKANDGTFSFDQLAIELFDENKPINQSVSGILKPNESSVLTIKIKDQEIKVKLTLTKKTVSPSGKVKASWKAACQ